MTVAELVVKISADASGLEKELKGVKSELGGLEKNTEKTAEASNDLASSFKNIVGTLKASALVAGIVAVSKVIVDLTKDFAEAEIATARLEKISELRGLRNAPDVIADLAQEIQTLTGASADLTVQLGAELIAQGKSTEQTRRLLALAADLSAITGQDLATSVRQLTTTYSGMAGQLGKLNPELKDLTEEELRNGAAVDVLEKKYGGMAKQLQGTTSVAFARLSENWGDFRENMGAIFAPMVAGLANLGNKILEFVNKGAPAFKVIGDAANVAYSVFMALNGGIVGLGLGIQNLSPKVKALWDILTGKASAEKEAAEQAMRHKENMAIVERATALYKSQLEKITKTVEGYTDAQLTNTKAILQNAIAATRDAGMREKLALELMAVEKEQAKRAKAAADEARKAATDRIKANQEVINGAKAEIDLLILQEQERARINGEEVDRAKIRESIVEKYLDLLKLQDDMTPAMKEQVKAILAMAEAWGESESGLNAFKKQTTKTTGEVNKLDSALKETNSTTDKLILDFTGGFDEATDYVDKIWGSVKGFTGSLDQAKQSTIALTKDFSKLLMSSKNEGAATAGAVLSIATTIFQTIDDLSKASEDRIKALAELNTNIQNQILKNAIDSIDSQMKKELEAAGFAEKTALEVADAKLKAAIDGGDAEAIAEAKREKEKAEIVDKYQKQKRALEIQMLTLQKQTALAQAKVDEQRALSGLGILATKAQKAQVSALYATLLASIAAVPIPAYAQGTNYHPGGMALVGEKGPEIVNLPKGSSVTPNNKLGGVTVNIYSPNAVTPSEAASVFKQTARELAFVGVL